MSINIKDGVVPGVLDDETLDLAHYWKIVRRSAFKIFLFALLFTLIVSFFVSRMTPLYTAKAVLLIETKPAKPMSIEEVYGNDTSRKDYMQTQFEILRSRNIAERTVQRLDLSNNLEFLPQKAPGMMAGVSSALSSLFSEDVADLSEEKRDEKRFRAAVTKLMSIVNVTLLDNTQIIEVRVTTVSPELSADIANTLSEVFVESYLRARVDMTSKATVFLTGSLDELRTKLEVAEANLAQFDENNELVNLNGVVGLASDELERLTSELLDAQARLKQNRAIYEQAVNNKADLDAIARLPEVLNHDTIRDVRRQESEALSRVSELKEIYGPKHPNMIAATAELTAVREILEKQISDLVASITTQYEVSRQRVSELQADLTVAKAKYRKLSNLESTRQVLQREVDINQQLYDAFFTRLKETSQLGGFDSTNARVLDSAVAPSQPSEPNTNMMIGFAFVFSLVTGVIVAIGVEAFNSAIRSVDDVEKKLGQRMLGLIPLLADFRKSGLPLRAFFDRRNYQFGEAIRTLRTGLSLLNIEKNTKSIMVTSSVPQEGKTTVSINLAFALGKLDKTVLIDADLRRPSVGTQFDIPNYQPGLTNLIMKTHTLDECMVHDEQSDIDIIPAGSMVSNPQELLAGNHLTEIVQSLKEKYKYVVVDTVPTQAVSDSVIVSKACDSVVYVVKADSTSEKVVLKGLGRFLQIGHRIDGVVLNQVDLSKADAGERYAGFYDQYGYGAAKNE
ncbi:chain-length determining protein [Alteromonas aestuariivivens]|uniref:non-specific protein-tyrosine kinase n=1 Tax=Alteromonas aestuariivivens TaxID=1938339 RepID=A0A3D8MD47_9ALTE|nr:polysaccharide biosynthesis tyrosine autokinase [Alteromonas aestuariivivens]RDV28160.1 chain-length determining protein [Alteromonas aestuariivivens]